MNPQVINISEFRLTNVALQLVFINILLELFFEMTKREVTIEKIPAGELFFAEIAFVLGALLVGEYLPLWNMK